MHHLKAFGRLAAMLGVVIAAGPTFAQVSIGVNFTGGSGGPGNDAEDVRSLSPGVTAGAFPAANWNNTAENATDGSLAALTDSSGAVTTASVTWDSDGTWTAHDTPPGSSGDQILTNGYIDETDPGNGPTNITLNNLPFVGPYDVYVYVGSDGNDRIGSGTIAGTGQTYFFSTNTNPYDGTLNRATATDQASAVDAEFLLFEGVTGTSFTYSQTEITNNVGIHGIQVVGVVPEPAALSLLGAVAAGVLGLRRRR